MVRCVIRCLLSLVQVGLHCGKMRLIIINPWKWQSFGKSAVSDSCMLDSLCSGHTYYPFIFPRGKQKGTFNLVLCCVFLKVAYERSQERKFSQCRRLEMSYKGVERAVVLRWLQACPSVLLPAAAGCSLSPAALCHFCHGSRGAQAQDARV